MLLAHSTNVSLPIGNYEALRNISWQEICKGLVLINSISATPQANFSLTSSIAQRNNEGLLRKVFKKTKNRSCLIFHTLNYKYMDLKSGRISGLLVQHPTLRDNSDSFGIQLCIQLIKISKLTQTLCPGL